VSFCGFQPLCFDQELFVNHFSLMAMAIFSSTTFAPFSATAQGTVTDPSAAVPPVVYQSVFNQSPTGVETKSVDWKKANAEVGQFKRGHVDILKWEESQARDKPMVNPPVVKPALRDDALPAKPTQPAAPGTHKH
jgi:hypothetical protein